MWPFALSGMHWPRTTGRRRREAHSDPRGMVVLVPLARPAGVAVGRAPLLLRQHASPQEPAVPMRIVVGAGASRPPVRARMNRYACRRCCVVAGRCILCGLAEHARCWRSCNQLDGYQSRIMWDQGSPLVFRTRAEAREYVARKYGYIRTRPDLRREPHGWRMPRAIRVAVHVCCPRQRRRSRER